MSLVKGVVASAAGGALGALTWAGVSYVSDYEIGWIAWGIGALAGYGMSRGLAGACDQASGIVAAVIAIAAVFAGKYAAIYLAVHQSVTEYTAEPIDDRDLQVSLADRVVEEREEEGRALVWPPGMTLAEADEPGDYPEGIWDEAQTRLAALAPAERDRMREEMTQQRNEAIRTMESSFASEGFMDSLSPYDLLWGVLAIMTAYKLASRRPATQGETPAG